MYAARLLPLLLGFAIAPGAIGGAAPPVYDRARFSQEVTECDRLAAHPDDPDRVAPGRSQASIDLPAAIAACEQAVAADPGNPRLRYQLARVYGYSGQGEKAGEHRQAAVDAGYPQALFVVGYLHLEGLNKAPKDVCRGAELIYRSARAGRLAGEVGFVKWALDGRFDACPVPKDAAEMRSFLDAADARTGDFYTELLIDLLRRDLAARSFSTR